MTHDFDFFVFFVVQRSTCDKALRPKGDQTGQELLDMINKIYRISFASVWIGLVSGSVSRFANEITWNAALR
jgi:hypothetical protein